jgi:hypothetical protein
MAGKGVLAPFNHSPKLGVEVGGGGGLDLKEGPAKGSEEEESTILPPLQNHNVVYRGYRTGNRERERFKEV